MTRSKHQGGFEFRELQDFNSALLTNMAARVMDKPNSLWVRVLKDLYFPRTDFMHGTRGGPLGARRAWLMGVITCGYMVYGGWGMGDLSAHSLTPGSRLDEGCNHDRVVRLMAGGRWLIRSTRTLEHGMLGQCQMLCSRQMMRWCCKSSSLPIADRTSFFGQPWVMGMQQCVLHTMRSIAQEWRWRTETGNHPSSSGRPFGRRGFGRRFRHSCGSLGRTSSLRNRTW